MKCVCNEACQARDDTGKIRTFMKGDVFSFKKCPAHFSVIEGPKAELKSDLATASREELLEGDYTVKQLRQFADATFGVKLKGTSKEDVVDSFLDAKFRYLEPHEAEGIL